MRTVDLIGVTDGFALFGNDKGLTVVVSLSNLDVFDPVPQVSVEFSRWGAPDPTQVPTEAYELASVALCSATAVEGTDVLIASGATDKRTFAVPRAAQAEVSRALSAVGKSGPDYINPVTLTMARTLTGKHAVNIATVRHISRFFDRTTEDTPKLLLSMWGGEPARKWAANIMQREEDSAILAALDFAVDEGTESTNQDPESTEIDPSEPHEFTPDVTTDDFVCEICGGDEDQLIHMVPYTENSTAVTAAGDRKIATAQQFYNVDPNADEGHLPEFYVVFDTRADGTPSLITDILAHRHDDTWVSWSPTGHNWSDTGEPSDAFPVDDTSAYEVAVLFDSLDTDAVPAQSINEAEWDAVQLALPGLPDFKESVLSELDFCAVMDTDDSASAMAIIEVYVREPSGDCWRWDPVTVDWAISTCPKDCVAIDEATARQAARRLTEMAAREDTGPNRGKFHGVPGSETETKIGPRLGKPHGRVVSMVPSTQRPGFEFDSAFGRAAWVSGTGGDGGPMNPGSSRTSFSIMELAGANDPTPGIYTPEERSQNASRQMRDSLGRFTKAGAIVHIKGSNRTGVVEDVDEARGTARVKYSDGSVQDVSGRNFVKIGQSSEGSDTRVNAGDLPGKPRATRLTPKAMLPSVLPEMTPELLKEVIYNYQEFIKRTREAAAKLSSFAALTPETTDVKPLYFAQVDELDKTAVLDLFAMVPKTKTTTEPILYIRSEGGWVRDDRTLAKLRSTSPPPMVVLDSAMYRAVLKQVDAFFQDKAAEKQKTAEQEASVSSMASLLASLRSRDEMKLWDDNGWLVPTEEAVALTAGGVPGVADTPGDIAAARKLRRYWLRGRGAAKIRWNTPGDWSRCVRHLSKYMGVRARGYCQLLHKDATGMYTGDKQHRKMFGRSKLLSTPTTVLASTDDVSADTSFLALVEVDIPTARDLSDLSTRGAGHALRVGERFLVDGGDGVYAVEVLEPTSTIGWEGAPALLVGGERYATLLQEA